MTILGRSEELVSRCVECDLAEPESLASLGGSAPGVVDGILSPTRFTLFIKMRNYVMEVEEPGYQVLPRSVLRIHDTKGIRKQKFIGTRKHNSEVVKMGGEQVTKDSDASTRDVAIKNIQGTSLYTMSDDIGGDDTKGKRRGKVNGCVAPRSYRDVVVNGKICQATT